MQRFRIRWKLELNAIEIFSKCAFLVTYLYRYTYFPIFMISVKRANNAGLLETLLLEYNLPKCLRFEIAENSREILMSTILITGLCNSVHMVGNVLHESFTSTGLVRDVYPNRLTRWTTGDGY